MASLKWIAQTQKMAASPSAGRTPDDPYFKLRLQAELNQMENEIPRPNIPSPIRYVNSWADRNRATLRKASEVAAYAAIRSQIVDPGSPVAARPIAPAPSSVPAAPALQPSDPIVADEQAENEDWLRLVAPVAVVEFKFARRSLDEAADLAGDEQSAALAQGLESMRRAMGKLADAVWPAQPGTIPDRLGKDAPTGERSYKSRISLALQGATNFKGQYRLAQKELALHHHRMSKLIDRISQGVHTEADYSESRQLYVGAWQTVAICRLHLPIGDFPLGQRQLPAGG